MRDKLIYLKFNFSKSWVYWHFGLKSNCSDFQLNNAQTRDSGIHYVNPTQRPATIYWAGKVYISTKVLRNLLGITINILRYMFNFDKYWFQKNIYNTFWNQINSFRYCFVNQPILVCETLLRKPDTRPVYESIGFANFANWNHSVN